MKRCKINKEHCILPLLLIAGCMCPPLAVCWDDSIVPKWYATAMTAIFCGIVCQRKDIRKKRISEWLSGMAVAASAGILFQAGYILLDRGMYFTQPAAGVTGTFDVPAGLALTICLLIPFAGCCTHAHTKPAPFKWLYVFSILVGVALVILSQSRAGILALCLIGIIWLYFYSMKRWMKVGIMLALTAGTCLAVIATKQESSSGRAFIMGQTISLIQEKPLTGHGFHGFSREYMKRQQHYFQVHQNTETARLADDIRHPLNEFLLTWTNYGIGGALLLLLCILLPAIVLHRQPLAWMISGTLLVFCTFSYPLSYPIAWIFLVGGTGIAIHHIFPFSIHRALLGSAITLTVCMSIALPCDILLSKAYDYSRRGGHSRAIATYKECEGLFRTFPFTLVYPFRSHQFLYNYTHELYTMGHLGKARQTATECTRYANSYNLQLLTADICQMQKDFQNAIGHYRNAHYMCPVRFAPLSGMLQVYQQTGDTAKADSIAQAILSKPIKIPSSDIDKMKEEAKKWMQSKKH